MLSVVRWQSHCLTGSLFAEEVSFRLLVPAGRTPPYVAASHTDIRAKFTSNPPRHSTKVSTLLTPMARLTVLTNHQVTDDSGLASVLLFYDA
jgi:hypothetical protein